MTGMTMQPRPNNPIEKRKQDVRKYSRNAVISVAAGLGGGVFAAWVFTHGTFFFMIGLIVAVVGGVYNWSKVRSIVNHKDQY